MNRRTTMQMLHASDPATRSADVIAANIVHLKSLFPEAIIEGKVNFDILQELLGGAQVEGEEKYGLNWHGKRRARQLALTLSNGTLRPSPADSVSWDTTKNLIIEGDNLEVLKLLQKSYARKVKIIYIDPPYNTGHDFVYSDDFRDSIQHYMELTGQVEGGSKISSNNESSGRFHTDWLNMMYPRLMLARQLLADDGVIFVSIDDTELGNLNAVLSELFGAENFQANISWQKRYTRSNNTVDFTTVVEHILVYSKSDAFRVNLLERTKEADARYSNPDVDARGPWKGASFLNPATPQQRPNLSYPITNPKTGEVTRPTSNAWRRSREEFHRLQADKRLYWGMDGTQPVPSVKMFLSEARNITPVNFWDHTFAGNTDDGTRQVQELLGEKVFDNPKPVQLIRRVLEHGSDADSLILDFFAGSGTTAQAVLEANASDNGRRRYILVQLPEPLSIDDKQQHLAADYCARLGVPMNIAELTKQRVRRAAQKLKEENPLFLGDAGFRVFRLDSTSIKPWEFEADQIANSLLDQVDHIKPDRTEQDVLFEVFVKFGLDLCVQVAQKNVAGHIVHSVADGVLLVCLSEQISSEAIESLASGIANWFAQLAPTGSTVCIVRDSAFSNDIDKFNFASILEQSGLGDLRSI